MNRNGLLIGAIIATGALLIWLIAFWNPGADTAAHKNPGVLAQAPQGGDFTLNGASGAVSLKDFRGKVTLLYFGYTYCPDVCPTSLSLMAQALSELDPAAQQKVRALFVSVDPERDTVERLKEYAPFFHPLISGITGTPEQIAAVARQYGASYMKHKPDANGHYVVDHSSVTYVIAPDGKLVASLPHASPPEAIVAEVRKLLPTAQ